MNKKMSYFILIFFLSFNLIISQEQTTNSTNKTQSLKDGMTFTIDIDPYKNFNFGHVITLDDSNATEQIKKHDLIYVLFYSVWCEPCALFFPTYVNTSNYAFENNLNITFAKIEGYNNTNTSKKFELQQFPSLFLIYKGKRFFYEGKRTQEAILKFVDRKLNNDIINLNSVSQINEYINSSFLTLLCTIKDKENILYKKFIEYSKEKMNIDFVICTSDECIKEYKENIVLFKEFDEKINLFTKDIGPINSATSDSLKEFIAVYTAESGGMMTSDDLNMMFEYKRNMLIYFRNSSDEKQTQYDKIMKEIGLELRNRNIYSVYSSIEDDMIHEHIAKAFMVLPIDLPALLLYDQNINSKKGDLAFLYILRNMKEEQFNKEYLIKYIDDIIAGKIPKTLFSVPPLENYYEDGLKIIIGRTFDSDVIENKNNVLLALIHGGIVSKPTENVLKIMKNLAKKYNEKDDKILFAFIDAQKNEPRDVVISGKTPPIVLLYTNAMEEKQKIELNSENFTLITEEEVENFLIKNLGWNEKKENKEPQINKNEKKEEIKEEKKKENKDEIKNEDNKEKTGKDKKEDDEKKTTDL